jgi:hypothetical protein
VEVLGVCACLSGRGGGDAQWEVGGGPWAVPVSASQDWWSQVIFPLWREEKNRKETISH